MEKVKAIFHVFGPAVLVMVWLVSVFLAWAAAGRQAALVDWASLIAVLGVTFAAIRIAMMARSWRAVVARHERFEHAGADDVWRLARVARTRFQAGHLLAAGGCLLMMAALARTQFGLPVSAFFMGLGLLIATVVAGLGLRLNRGVEAVVTLFEPAPSQRTRSGREALERLRHSWRVDEALRRTHGAQGSAAAIEVLGVLRDEAAFWPKLAEQRVLRCGARLAWRVKAAAGLGAHALSAGLVAWALALLLPLKLLPPVPSPLTFLTEASESVPPVEEKEKEEEQDDEQTDLSSNDRNESGEDQAQSSGNDGSDGDDDSSGAQGPWGGEDRNQAEGSQGEGGEASEGRGDQVGQNGDRAQESGGNSGNGQADASGQAEQLDGQSGEGQGETSQNPGLDREDGQGQGRQEPDGTDGRDAGEGREPGAEGEPAPSDQGSGEAPSENGEGSSSDDQTGENGASPVDGQEGQQGNTGDGDRSEGQGGGTGEGDGADGQSDSGNDGAGGEDSADAETEIGGGDRAGHDDAAPDAAATRSEANGSGDDEQLDLAASGEGSELSRDDSRGAEQPAPDSGSGETENLVQGGAAGDGAEVDAEGFDPTGQSHPFAASGTAPEGLTIFQGDLPDYPDNLVPAPPPRTKTTILDRGT
jgi:hypothetical protein